MNALSNELSVVSCILKLPSQKILWCAMPLYFWALIHYHVVIKLFKKDNFEGHPDVQTKVFNIISWNAKILLGYPIGLALHWLTELSFSQFRKRPIGFLKRNLICRSIWVARRQNEIWIQIDQYTIQMVKDSVLCCWIMISFTKSQANVTDDGHRQFSRCYFRQRCQS